MCRHVVSETSSGAKSGTKNPDVNYHRTMRVFSITLEHLRMQYVFLAIHAVKANQGKEEIFLIKLLSGINAGGSVYIFDAQELFMKFCLSFCLCD